LLTFCSHLEHRGFRPNTGADAPISCTFPTASLNFDVSSTSSSVAKNALFIFEKLFLLVQRTNHSYNVSRKKKMGSYPKTY